MAKINKNRLLSFLLIYILSLSGCSISKTRDNITINNTVAVEDSSSSLDLDSKPTIAPKDELSQEYLSYFYNLEFNYNYEELYPNQKTLDKIIENNNQLKECNYKFDGNVGALVDNIKDNTQKFISLHSEYSNPFKIYASDYQKALTEVIVSIKKYCHNNINEDFHQISNMIIVIGSSEQFAGENTDNFYIAYYEDKLNVIVVNQKYLEMIVEDNKFPYEKYLYYTISHELNHTRENVCPCNYNQKYNNINYSNEGYSFILESAAESDLYNVREFSEILSSYSYTDERKAEGELMLLGILSDSLDDYYNAIFDIDYNLLFDFFDLKTKEEQVAFLKILYAIDGRFCRNQLPYNMTDNDISKTTINTINKMIGLTYKENIFKYSIINLIEYTSNNEDFSLQENLVLFNIIKAYLIDNTYNFDEITYECIYDEEVLVSIDTMEKTYIEYISQKYNISLEKIREYENTEIVYIIEQAKRILESENNDNLSSYGHFAQNIMDKYPVVRAILRTNLNLPYNIYDSRISQLKLK